MPKKMDIINEEKEFLVINKPTRLLTISTPKEKEKTLYQEASSYVKKQNPKNKVFIVHRLDKDTSGIVVFAKNEKLKLHLQEHWDESALSREYLAIVEGNVSKEEDTIINYLKESKTLQVYVTPDQKNGKKSITHYQKIGYQNGYSLLKIKIDTGRKNQIRVTLASLGHPIVGDKKYQAKKNPLGRLGLHAHKLILLHPKTRKKMTFEAKIPKEFQNLFPELKGGLHEKKTND